MRRTTAAVLLAAGIAVAQPFSGGPALDAVVEKAIHDQLIPGAVLVIGHNGQVIYHKAYGWRALVPAREPMTEDTIFDAASLTKVVATASSMMRLVEQGKVRVNDRVTEYLPEFQGGKSEITVRDLLTHFSGLRPDLDMPPQWRGYETGIRLALADKPVNPPGARFVYSDINFILLGEIIHRVSGQSLAEFARQNVFEPVGMRESSFNPPSNWLPRIAPTEIFEGKPLRGVVHDPTSRAMGGVAGHAGLFTTAADLSRFAEMLLKLGESGGRRVFSPLTVRKFTTPETPADQPILRGFGWDIDSPFSSNRGELFPIGSYGHTGFTGTSIWIDPFTQSYVILLTNSVHPHLGKSTTGLRARVATVAAAGLGVNSPGVLLTGYNETITGAGIRRTMARNADVFNGIDVLAEEKFSILAGKRVGLITNHTGLLRDGRRNLDAMLSAGVKLTAIFTPEHGITGKEDREEIGNSTDRTTGVPVISLYNAKQRRLTPEMLANIDTIVFDIQDIGTRFYTYSCTLMYALEEAARNNREIIVLDRPNPITGVKMEGPILERGLDSFVGCFEMPLRHGMTFGELARMMSGERKMGANLKVIPMRGWQRGDWFDSVSQRWVDPSPNIRSLSAALLYPGVAMIEYSKNYSVGRGTDAPFEQVGADWIRGQDLARALNLRLIPGVRVYPTRFKPTASNFAGKEIEGVRFLITDREAFDSVRFGLELAYALEKLYPGKIEFEASKRLVGSQAVVDMMKAAEDPRTSVRKMEEPAHLFEEARRPYLLY
jgi:uncharacterized protein YbbC (DUF1343 family)/CubicO group peptidase (beta-lactamase class C family)